MKHSASYWQVGGVLAIPALLFTAYVMMSFTGEYYYGSYMVMGIVFVIASFSAGMLVSRRIAPGTSRRRSMVLLFLGLLVAWVMALAVLAVLSMTPLCVGRDNGDGNNDIGLCGFYVTLAAVFYSVPMALLMGIASGAAGWLLMRFE